MKKLLRTIACAVLAVAATNGWAQAPQSGTYKIKSSKGKYVKIQGKYYAKPEATADDASIIGLGVGYNTGDGYRVFSLTGTNPTDNSTIEVYDYINKACNIVSNLAQEKINGKAGSLLEKYFTGEDNAETRELLTKAIDAMADSVCRIYTDDYAYMTLVPEGHYGTKWVVRAKATVPEIPYSIKAVGDYYTKGHVVNAGHSCTDVWDWAKQHVLKYLSEHQTNAQLRALVETYLDQVDPGTTYYLTCEDNETFGFETSPSDDGLWTLEPVLTAADGLTPGTYNIKNNNTEYYVNMKGKYYAEPELTLDDIQNSTTNKQNAAFALDFGRYNKDNKNLYRITELANQDRDAVSYITKGMNKAFELVDKKLKEKDFYSKLVSKP